MHGQELYVCKWLLHTYKHTYIRTALFRFSASGPKNSLAGAFFLQEHRQYYDCSFMGNGGLLDSLRETDVAFKNFNSEETKTNQ